MSLRKIGTSVEHMSYTLKLSTKAIDLLHWYQR